MSSEEKFINALKNEPDVVKEFHTDPAAVLKKYGLKNDGEGNWKLTRTDLTTSSPPPVGAGVATSDLIIASRECWRICSAIFETEYEREDIV